MIYFCERNTDFSFFLKKFLDLRGFTKAPHSGTPPLIKRGVAILKRGAGQISVKRGWLKGVPKKGGLTHFGQWPG